MNVQSISAVAKIGLIYAITGLMSQRLFADKFVYVDVEFKIMLPTDTSLAAYTPATLAKANTDADALINASNQAFDRSLRGLRYRRFGDVLFVTAADVGDSNDGDSLNDLDNLFRHPNESDSDWYNRSFTQPFTLAPARPTEWKYRADVCNFYVFHGFGGGVGSVSGQDKTLSNIVVQGHLGIDPGIHELGHWFALPHTFWSVETNTPLPAGSAIQWGDDGFSDTLKDWHQGGHTLDSLAKDDNNGLLYTQLNALQKAAVDLKFRNHYAKQFYNALYSDLTNTGKAKIQFYQGRDQFNDSFNRDSDLIRDLIANGNFGTVGTPTFYSDLNAANKQKVDDLIMNIESYHFGKGGTGYFSELQMDRMCDIISQPTDGRDRSATRALESGKFIFFGGPTTVAGAPSGSSLRPKNNIASAHDAVTAYVNVNPNNPPKTDVILGRPGTYPVPNGSSIRINKPCTIRATKAGAFSIVGQ